MTSDTPDLCDGAAFFDGRALRNTLYDSMYGSAMAGSGDKAFIKNLIARTGGDILDAACGTGRLFSALARPGRRIEAFDASEELLRRARERADALRHLVPIGVSRQRLESFEFQQPFDLILVAYYGFSCLLDPAARDACLRRIAAHLKPGGLAVLQLPAPGLLSRDVPAHELAAMRAVRLVREANGAEFQVEHLVTGMDYDPVRMRRSIHVSLSLADRSGRPLHRETATLRYACITGQELQEAAAQAGLGVRELRGGFRDGDESELVAILHSRGFPSHLPA